ncbi:hypothetical protein ACF0H5_013618 [Mactra antiquata]
MREIFSFLLYTKNAKQSLVCFCPIDVALLTVVVKAVSKDVCNLPDGQITVLPESCNFNNGECGYDFPDNLWGINTENFGSIIYGQITGDNTGPSQTFALFQSNDPTWNDTTVTNSSIQSTEVYYRNTPICLKFWHLMPNQNSKLEVYLIHSPTNISTMLFDHAYSSISQWKEVKIPLTVSSNFKVEFQSERENAYGYVGVDNVQFIIEIETTVMETTIPLETTTAKPKSTTPIITTTERLTTSTPSTLAVTTETYTSHVRTAPSSVFTVCDLPPERLSVLYQYSCNFDHDMCGYTLLNYPHLWEMTSHRYGDSSVGEIIGDHSIESLGGYMVFNTYNNHVQNKTSHYFHSPTLLPFTQYCASFWYNMPNNDSALDVYAELRNGTSVLLWQQSGRPTSGWAQAKVPLLQESSFSLIFSSTKMTSLSFVGVDDITISIKKPNITMATGRKRRSLSSILGPAKFDEDSSSCSCTCPAYHVIQCKTTTRPIPPYVQSCSDLVNAVYVKEGSCDFDDGTSCSYNIPVYPHLWELVKYEYGNQSTGIIDGDQSGGGNGVYLAFTTDDLHVPFGMTSNFRSGTLPEVGNLCLSFWYNLPTNSASLSVYKEAGDKNELLWKTEYRKSTGWQRATILFKAESNMKIDFVSSKSTLDAYFGVDNIQLYRNVTM